MGLKNISKYSSNFALIISQNGYLVVYLESCSIYIFSSLL